jgi:S-adenosyl-methyltransferase MraW
MEVGQFNHYTVMKNEAIDALDIKEDGVYIDATLGGGGHSLEIVKKLGDDGKLIAIDRDSEAIEFSKNRLKDFEEKICYVKDNYSNITDILNQLGYEQVDGVLIDLGVSSYQIDSPHRGFSYMKEAPLDMRMDKEQSLTAKTVVNKFERDQLKEILYKYGEERYTERIVGEIIKRRELKPIETTAELVEIIKYAVRNVRYDGGHPAKRTFQAIRICVNDELGKIEPTVNAIIESLKPTGRIVAISFHSLEDKIIKQCFNKYEKGCDCPPAFPICVCGKKPAIKTLTKKPAYPSQKELGENSRSESAKMRVAEKL